MSIVSEVKCPRCDRKYSGIRRRCPYCGARRTARGKHSNSAENSKGRIIIGLLLMGVLVVAVVVLLVSSLKDPNTEGTVETPPSIPPSSEGIDKEPGTVVSTDPDGDVTSPEGTGTPSPSETPEPKVESVTITYQGSKREEFTCKIGEVVPLKAKIVPEGTEERVEWSSSDEDIFTVGPETGSVTGLSQGIATLTVTVGDVSATCKVIVSSQRYNG